MNDLATFDRGRATGTAALAAPILTIVIPILNERDNIKPLGERPTATPPDIAWEALFVHDDLRDGTSDHVHALGPHDPRIRCLQRIGRPAI